MAKPIIVCSNVCVAYGRQEVLHRVNLEIPEGIFLPFIGPNGSGKTTLLRAILGLIPVRHGRIDTPFGHVPAGYVSQQKVIDPLFPVSVRQIVEMGLSPKRRPWARLTRPQRESIDKALAEFGMEEHANKNFRELSGGMKQKVLIARAFVSKPNVIVLDEPTSELDEKSEKDVLRHLLDLNQKHGKTVLMVHHDTELVSQLSNTVCRVNRGSAEIVENGFGGNDHA